MPFVKHLKALNPQQLAQTTHKLGSAPEFVDASICEMRKNVVRPVQVVLLCAKPNQSLLVDVDLEGIEAGHCHVHADIELVSTWASVICG